MANREEYIYNLVDQISPKLDRISKNLDKLDNNFEETTKSGQKSFNGLITTSTLLKGAIIGVGVVAAKNMVKSFYEAGKETQRYTTQFTTLLGSVDKAKERIEILTNFAAKTPFQLAGIANASKVLQTLTEGTLATGEGLRLVGDAAATTGADFENLAMHVGRAYSGLQANRPVGESMMRLQELGLVSGDTRNKIEELQKQSRGKDAWQVLQNELKKSAGGMEALSKTVEGRMSTIRDQLTLARVKILEKSGAWNALGEAVTSVSLTLEKMDKDGTIENIGKAFTGLINVINGAIITLGGLEKELKKHNAELDVNIEKTQKNTKELRLWKQALEDANDGYVKSPITGRQIRESTALKIVEQLKGKIKETAEETKKLSNEFNKVATPKTPTATTTAGTVAAKPAKEFKVDEVTSYFQTYADKMQQQADFHYTVIEAQKAHEKELHDQSIAWSQERTANFIEQENIKKQEREKILNDTITSSVSGAQTINNTIFSSGQQRNNNEKKQAIERIKNSNKSEKEKQKAIEAIDKEYAEKGKKRDISRALINAALAITKVFATTGPPASFILAGATAAATGIQIGTMANQKFARGIEAGPVRKEPGVPSTGDQHIARVNPGEWIVTPQQMRGMQGSNVTMGDTNLIIQGNVTEETVGQISATLEDHREKLREDIMALQEAGRMSGVSF